LRANFHTRVCGIIDASRTGEYRSLDTRICDRTARRGWCAHCSTAF
jgi:hypothetical protein